MKELAGYIIERFDLTLWMRFIITLILLYMLYQAMFGLEDGMKIDEAWKNVLVLLVGTAVGYFFATSKGASDTTAVIRDIAATKIPTPSAPPDTTTTVTTRTEPNNSIEVKT